LPSSKDLFSAGSVANPSNDNEGGSYIERALKLKEMREAALTMDSALFVEFWGGNEPPGKRIQRWLERADVTASSWKPSASLFLDQQEAF
jgi:hypothetical protein